MTDKPRSPRPPRPNPFGDDPKPKRPRPGTNKFETHPRVVANKKLEQAKLELGDPAAMERARARLPIAIAKLLMQFQTNLGRRHLVELMVGELTGDEVALPADILEEVDFMLAEDAKRTPDAEPFKSVSQGLMLLRRLSRELREGRA